MMPLQKRQPDLIFLNRIAAVNGVVGTRLESAAEQYKN